MDKIYKLSILFTYMPGRKRTYTSRSIKRYIEKRVKFHTAQGIPLEMAVKLAEDEGDAWHEGFMVFKAPRDILRSILEDGGVPTPLYAPFCACLNDIKRRVRDGDLPENTIAYMVKKYGEILNWTYNGNNYPQFAGRTYAEIILTLATAPPEQIAEAERKTPKTKERAK